MNNDDTISICDVIKTGNPIHDLWCTVILSAAKDLLEGKESGVWFFTSDKSSFLEICEHLNLDPDNIRKQLLNSIIEEDFYKI